MNRTNSLFSFSLITSAIWTLVLAGLLSWNIRTEINQTITQATHQTRTFFKQFLLARFWNSLHGGVYVPITEETPPNPYLDETNRDIVTPGGLRLTKINPAYMTRQVAKIAAQRGEFSFHITALLPINPDNSPDSWEMDALKQFVAGKQEFYEMKKTDQGSQEFRYMGVLSYEKSCLECHEAYGSKEGDLSGGISVSMPANPLIASQNKQIQFLSIAYALIWLMGIGGLLFLFSRLRKEENQREKIISELETALGEVKQLSGLLPICCSCKKIRDDSGYWQGLEQYISEHSQAQFTHGLCQECAFKLYPEFIPQLKKAAEKNLKQE